MSIPGKMVFILKQGLSSPAADDNLKGIFYAVITLMAFCEGIPPVTDGFPITKDRQCKVSMVWDKQGFHEHHFKTFHNNILKCLQSAATGPG